MVARLTGPTDLPKYSYIKKIADRISSLECRLIEKDLAWGLRYSNTELHQTGWSESNIKAEDPPWMEHQRASSEH